MIRKNGLSIYRTNILYLILALSLIFVGSKVQSINLFTGILITEILLLVVPNIWFIKSSGMSIKKEWRLNSLGFKNIILIFFISIFTYPIAVFFQAIFVTILGNIKEIHPNTLPIEISQIPFLWSVFFVAIVPGICEEIMFRGTILRAYEKLGIKKTIVISAVLFGVFHFTLLNLIGPIVLGIVFGIMVYKTNSLYSSMIAHTFNNLIALILNYFLMRNVDLMNDVASQEMDMDTLEILITFAIIGIFIFLLIKIVKILLNKLTPSRGKYVEVTEIEDQTEYMGESIEFFSYIPLIIVAIMFFIFNFIFI